MVVISCRRSGLKLTHKEVKSLNLKRTLALALAALMILTVPVAFGAEELLPRLSGADRYATAVEVSKEGWETAVTVVLARGDHFADALAGVPLAHKLEAPILLTAKDSLPAVTKAEIERLHATKIVILGGTGAISKAVADALATDGKEVVRIAGANRYDTAALIADEVVEEGAVGTVVLANGENFADALAAAPYAAANGYPILLTAPKSLPEETELKINELAPNKMIIVGGTAAISQQVMTAVSTRNPVRVSGSNRYATAVALANHFQPESTLFYIASGLDFPDAITGAVLAAKNGTGLLLVDKSLPVEVKNFIDEFGVFEAVIFGGLKAVSADVEGAIHRALTGSADTAIAGWTEPGATVTVGKKSVTASTTGFYKITGLAPGSQTQVTSLTGHKSVKESVVVFKDEVSVNNPVLEGLEQGDITIKIAAVLANGAPVVGAEVYIAHWIPTAKAYGLYGFAGETNENGVLEIENDGDPLEYKFGEKLKVMVGLDPAVDEEENTITGGYHWITREVVLATDAEENELDGYVLTPVKKMTITGKVTGLYGQPLGTGENVEFIYGFDIDEDELLADFDVITAEINDKGEYKFANLFLPTGKYVIRFAHSNEELAIHAAVVSVTEGNNLTHDIKLVNGYPLHFKLDTEEAGERFKDEDIFAGLYSGDLLLKVLDVNLADGGEYFNIRGDRVAAGSYTLKVFGDYIIAKSFPITFKAEDAVEGKILKAGRTFLGGVIKGVVQDLETTAIASAQVDLLDAAGKVAATKRTNADGEYRFGGLPHGGKYTVRGSKAGYLTAIRPDPEIEEDNDATCLEVIANDDVEQVINLKPVPKFANVKGFVRTTGSYIPATDAVVFYHAVSVINPATGKPFRANYCGTESDPWIAEVEDDGSYAYEGLLPGTYRVVVRDSGNHEYNISTLTVAAGDDLEAKNYFLTKGGDAVFNIRLKAGADIVTDVKLYDAYDVEIDWGQTVELDDEQDAVQFEDLSAGVYYVEATDVAGYKDFYQSFAVAKSTTTTREAKMTKLDDTFEVNFAVYGKQNASLEDDVTILVYSGAVCVYNNQNPAGGETDMMALLPKGNYTAEFWTQDYVFHAEKFSVVDKNIWVRVLQLKPWR